MKRVRDEVHPGIMINARTPLTGLSVVLLLLSGLLTLVGGASGLTVEPDRIEHAIEPGVAWSETILLSSGPDETVRSFLIEVQGLGQSPLDGSYLGLEEPEDTSPYSARPFLRVNASTLHLNPGNHQEVLATVKVPEGDRGGGMFAALVVRRVEPTTGQPEGDPLALIPVFLQVQGVNITETGEITALEYTSPEEGGGFTITTWFRNTGNHQIEGTLNRVTITDRNGVVIVSDGTTPLKQALIPGQEARFTVSVDHDLPDTEYLLTTRIGKLDSSLLAEQKELLPGTGSAAENQDSQSPIREVQPTRRVPGFETGAALVAILVGIRFLKRIAIP